jgi:2-oxoglutarate ferredoxin oxidoreductase subunit alpha
MRKTVIFAGEAGQGIDRTAVVFGKMVASLGYSCFIYRDYSSLIRGGHNFSIVTFSAGPVRAHDEKAHAIIALDPKAALKHKNSLHKGGAIFSAEEGWNKNGSKHAANNILLGMAAKYFSVPKNIGMEALRKEFGVKTSEMEGSFDFGYSKDLPGPDLSPEKGGVRREVSDGNKAVMAGALDSGVGAVFYYPMTPATGVFAKLEETKKETGVIVEQMEDEIAAANAALGASYAGMPSMTGSSGGGLALMGEAASFAGMAELPAVFYAAQRMGPSTGVPTYTAQGDLKFVLNMGPGEFPRIAFIPGDIEDAYKATREAFYFSSKYRMPAFIISDKHIAESYSTHSALKSPLPKIKPLPKNFQKDYKSYSITENGISPAVAPGGPQTFRATSYEHDEYGHTTEDPAIIKGMNDKRLRKVETLKKELAGFPGVSVFGKGKKAIVFAGSPKGAVLDALPTLKGYRAVQINRLYPFPAKELARALKNAPFHTVENNTAGQLALLVREATGLKANKSLLRYDGRPFTPENIIKFFKSK